MLDITSDVPNEETVKAIEELDNGDGERIESSTKDFLKEVLKQSI